MVRKLLFGLFSFVVIFGGTRFNGFVVSATGLPISEIENAGESNANKGRDFDPDQSAQPFSEDEVLLEGSDLAAGVSLTPEYQGVHTHPGGLISFDIQIYNTGGSGTDTYNLGAASVWPVTFFAADGNTPITDTGPVGQGGNVTIVAKVLTPGDASLGDYNVAIVTATSSLNPSLSGTVTL